MLQLAGIRPVALPVRPLPSDQLLYERNNGHFVLQIAGHPDYGVPFGQDRIVPIFLATLAVQQKSQIIRFKSASEMLDIFGMSKGGKQYRRLIAAFERDLRRYHFFRYRHTHIESEGGAARSV